MSNVVQEMLVWFANAFYVIVALAIVYLFFFQLVPKVIGSVNNWNFGSVFRITFVLALIAIILGSVAIFAADWIFGQVLDTLPRTRMAEEVNRVTGSILPLTTDDSGPRRLTDPFTLSGGEDETTETTEVVIEGQEEIIEEYELKPTAMSLWMGVIQAKYNQTGDVSANQNVMGLRDIPRGVACEVYDTGSGWMTKRFEEWELNCTNDNFVTEYKLNVNGTAARGLTGGRHHSRENKQLVNGIGLWPEIAYEEEVVLLDENGDVDGEVVIVEEDGTEVIVARDARAGNRPTTHTVKSGESIALIANQYNITEDQLIDANLGTYPQLENDRNVIQPDWVLTIP
ncbi:MAG: LysM peptidoglycan-binding domain-containing protein [Chloroflexota bacterium]